MKSTFLFVGEQPDFASTLFESLEKAGKVVIRAGSVAASLKTLHGWAIDSVLVDPALADDPLIVELVAAAKLIGADFWILDAARVGRMNSDIAAGR